MKLVIAIFLILTNSIAYADMQATPVSEQLKLESTLETTFKQLDPDITSTKLTITGIIKLQLTNCPFCPPQALCPPCTPNLIAEVEVLSGDLNAGTTIAVLLPPSMLNAMITGNKYVLKMMLFGNYSRENPYRLTGYELVKNQDSTAK